MILCEPGKSAAFFVSCEVVKFLNSAKCRPPIKGAVFVMARATIRTRTTSLSDDLQTGIDGFLSYCRSKGLSLRTQQFYSERLEQFRRYLACNDLCIAPKDIDAGIIRAFIDDTRVRCSVSTANHNLNVLRIFMTFLSDEGWITGNPAKSVDRLKTHRKLIDAVSPDTVKSLVATCDVKTFCGARDRAILLTLFDCGIRVGELVNVRLDCLNWAEQTVLVSGKTGERVVPFGATVRQALNAYISSRGEIQDQTLLFVTQFGDAMTRYSIRDMLERRAKDAGLQDVRIHAHAFRHGAALEILRAGASAFHVQKLLGHQTLDMSRTYVELVEADLRNVHEQCSPTDRLGLSKPRGRLKKLK